MRCSLADRAPAPAARALSFGLVAFLWLLLPSCEGTGNGSGAAVATREVTDGLGRKVTVPALARRVVALGPSNTETLFAIGAGAQVVGRDDPSDFPPEARSVKAIGAGPALNLESLVALRPDLVIVAQIYAAEQLKTLEGLHLTVYFVSNPKSFDDLYSNVRLLGALTGRETEAARVASGLKTRVEDVLAKVRDVRSRPTVYYELDATDPMQPWTAGPGTFLDLLIELAGGRNFAAKLEQPFPRLSAETIIRGDPDVIVLGDAGYGITAESVRGRAGWSGLAAVKRGAIHPFDDNLASRPGPRLVDGLETLAKLLHPEVFDASGVSR